MKVKIMQERGKKNVREINAGQIHEESESQNNGGKKQEVESQKSEEKVKVIWERVKNIEIRNTSVNIHIFCFMQIQILICP